MATDRIRELAHAILSECAVWYLLPQGETPEVKEQRVVSTLDVAEAMLRAALADKALIGGELAAARQDSERLREAQKLIGEVYCEFVTHKFQAVGPLPTDGSSDTRWMKEAKQWLDAALEAQREKAK